MPSIAQRVAARFMEALVIPREYHLPDSVRGMPPVVPEGTDIAAWKYERNGVPYGIAFMGKSNKPVWHYRLRNDAEFDKILNELADRRREYLKSKQDEQNERKNFLHDVKIGDIYSTSWGYDQTNIDFYEVTAIKGKVVEVREVAKKDVSEAGDRGYDRVIAVPGRYVGPVIRVLPRPPSGSFKVEGHYASKWDGKPQHQTASGYGH
jgi:hypothetical protein